MNKLTLLFAALLIVVCLAVAPAVATLSADEAVVRAILFYTPTCPACHRVNEQVLDPMLEDYGDRLQILRINTLESSGYEFYLEMVERYQIAPDRQGVPTIVIGDTVLVGSDEIPQQFPPLVEEGLAAGGIGWPDIPGTTQAISESRAASLASVGVALAWVVLAGMVAALGYAAWRVAAARRRLSRLWRLDRDPIPYAETWAIPLLILVGLGIAMYLSYVEIAHVEAFCGPIGECSFVQSSPYARILGIPVAVLGVVYYLAIGALWAGRRYLVGRGADLATLGLLGLTLFGVLFSIYLTCLELFVVQAVCSWCLASAVATTILMLLVAVPVTADASTKRGRR